MCNTHTHSFIHTLTHMHTCKYTRHTHTHTHKHKHTSAHAHTQIHTHTQRLVSLDATLEAGKPIYTHGTTSGSFSLNILVSFPE